MNKLRFIFGVLAILAVLAFVGFIYVSSISIAPADTKIVDILYENEEEASL